MKLDNDKVIELLETLKNLPKIREVKELQKRLQKELQKPKIKKTIPKEIKTNPNLKRSSKQKRYWRYIKLIRDNFPNLQTNEIRKQLKDRRQGKQVPIRDAVWQNPSP